MKADNSKSKSRDTARAGFTLVEMLVSVTLVLLLMTMFATIFQIATASISKQRGIAENDQRARVISTVVRKDFQHRTSRFVLPFYPGENSATSPTPFSNRAGYIYISTNDPYTGLDDLVQFTVSANILSEDSDSTPYFGRAAELSDRNTLSGVANGLHISPNQPETDDGSFSPDSVSSSPYAEVSYFIRNGSLYRRVVLIREPLSVAGQNFGAQPTSASGYNYFSGQPNPSNAGSYDGLFKVVDGSFQTDSASPPFGTLTNDFHLLFDHSAHALIDGSGNQSAALLSADSLTNETAGGAAELLANPANRFGFNPFTKRSREHTVSANTALRPVSYTGPTLFMGRLTQAETSSLNYNWPQNTSREELPGQLLTSPDSSNFVGVDLNFDGTVDVTSTNGNPLDLVATPLVLNPGNGVVSSFDSIAPSVLDPISGKPVEGRGGIRRVEDLLLANVHEMKIELWDARLQRFVVPGHFSTNPLTGQVGDYSFVRCHNPNNVPDPGSNLGAVFDTWHPTAAAFDSDGSGLPLSIGEQSAPYVPYLFYPPRQIDVPPGPSPPGMPGPFASYWTSGSGTFIPGVTVVFAPVGFDGDTPNEIFEWQNLPPAMGPTADIVPPQAFQIAYRCVATQNINGINGIETGASPPNFPTSPGRRITDGEVTWESFDNRRPLEAIRMTFRFHDKTSDNLRQLSLVIPLTE